MNASSAWNPPASLAMFRASAALKNDMPSASARRAVRTCFCRCSRMSSPEATSRMRSKPIRTTARVTVVTGSRWT